MANFAQLRSLKNMAAYYERKVQALPPYFAESYLPNQSITSNKLKYLVSQVSAPTLAAASSYDASPEPSNRDGFQEKLMSTQFFRKSSVLTEHDAVDINTALTGNQSDPYLQTVVKNIFDNQTKDLLSMRARRNYLGTKAIVDAEIPLKVGGQIQTFKFDVKPDFQQEATTDWSNAKEANVYQDVKNVLKTMRQIGLIPNQAIMNDNTFEMIQNSDRMKNTIPSMNVNIANGNLSENQVVDYFKSEFHLAIVRCDDVYRESDLSATNNAELKTYVPDGKVAFVFAPMPNQSYIVPGTNSSQVSDLSGGQWLGHMNFAPTPEQIGVMTGKYSANDVITLDTGVTYHRYIDRRLAREEDLTSMNVFPSLEGSQTIFRLTVAGQNNDNPSQGGNDNPGNNEGQKDTGDGKQVTPPKA